MRDAVRRQMPLIGVLVAQLTQQRHDEAEKVSHASSGRRVSTNGVSVFLASRVPLRMPVHTRIESTRMIATRIMKTAVTPASSRALKISAAVAEVCGPLASASACARKPSAGALSKIFCHPAVKHTTVSHASGTQVIHI